MRWLIILLPLLLFSFDLDKEIEKLQTLPPSERYKLMNKIKIEILKLNEKERIKALKKLLKKHYQNYDNSILEDHIDNNIMIEGDDR